MPTTPDPDEPSTLRPTSGPMLNVPSKVPGASGTNLGTFGKYKLQKQLGAGGMGAVYLAEDTALQRPVAIKTLLADMAQVPEYKERFLREARSAAAIKHDNVITIYSVEEIDGIPLLVMERLKGQSLEDFLRKGGKLGPLQITRIGRETAQGLKAAHDMGMIHRDIKPANIWLEAPKGKVKVLDFGLAVRPNQDLRLSVSGAVMGTPYYMAPEQARGVAVDPRADLFSLGVVLYQLCTGRRPFDGESMMAVLMAVGTHTPPPPSTFNPDVPPAMDALVMGLLAKDPADRPQSAADVIATLSKPMAWADAGGAKPGGTDAVNPPSTIYPPVGTAPTLVPLDTLPPALEPFVFTAQPLADTVLPLLGPAAEPPPPMPLELSPPRRGRWKKVVLLLLLVGGAVAAGVYFSGQTDRPRTFSNTPTPTSRPKADAPPPANKEKPDDPPPFVPKPTEPGVVRLAFDDPNLRQYFGERTTFGLAPPAANGLELFIDGGGAQIVTKLSLPVGLHTIQIKRNGSPVFAADVTVTPPDEGETTLKVPFLFDPDAKGILVFNFKRQANPRVWDHVELFVDGKTSPLYRITAALTTDPTLTVNPLPGEHQVVVRYKGIEVYSKAVTVKRPDEGRTFEAVEIETTGTVRLVSNLKIGAKVTAYVSIDGLRPARLWERGTDTLDIPAEIGKRKVRVWMTTPFDKEIGEFELDVKPGRVVKQDVTS